MKKKNKKERYIGDFLVPTKKYKYKQAFYNKIYKLNKAKVDEAYGIVADPKGAFIESIKEKLKTKTLSKSLKQLGKSEIFIPYAERARNNMMKALHNNKKFPGITEALRRANGWKKSTYKTENLRYIGNNTYEYEDAIISVQNSPEKIIIYKKEDNSFTTIYGVANDD